MSPGCAYACALSSHHGVDRYNDTAGAGHHAHRYHLTETAVFQPHSAPEDQGPESQFYPRSVPRSPCLQGADAHDRSHAARIHFEHVRQSRISRRGPGQTPLAPDLHGHVNL